MKLNMTQADYDAILEYLEECQHDPELFVRLSFPWGEVDTPLENKTGPEEWQLALLRDIKKGLKTPDQVIRSAIASGHGIGKSAMVSWLVLWAIGTAADCKIVVTANTEPQLRTKTWPEIGKWFNMWIAKDLFTYTSSSIFSKEEGHEKTWRCDAIPWSVTSPESFAGLHNQGNRILVIFDEASAIEDVIWETTEGALTDKDTEIIWCCFGNPTRNSGRFYECFHKHRELWRWRKIDSRTISFTNKDQLEEWRKTYGEDSDFFKVRVRGEFPSASDKQFIPQHLVDEARHRVLKRSQYEFAPVILGLDPAWTGSDATTIYLRQGLRSKRLFKLQKNDNDLLLAKKLAEFEDMYHADAVFIDLGYGTGIKSTGDAWGRNWTLVSFGATKGVRQDCCNKRAEMWQLMKEWLMNGGCISDDDYELADDLVAPEQAPTDDGRILLEKKESMKKRGVASPNCADALALTFAYPVLSRKQLELQDYGEAPNKYDPFAGM